MAFGRGEWFGQGLGNSIQKLEYLPEAHTYFVFAVLAEELGFVGVVLVLMLIFSLVPGERALIPTGLRVEIPPGFEMQIRPRSGLALKQGLSLPNTPGTIDSDYRGPLGVLLVNLGAEPFHIAHGDRIAQMIVAPVIQASFAVVGELSDTERGAGGFGSTGRD